MSKSLDPSGRKPPQQPKVRNLTPRPAPAKVQKLKTSGRDRFKR
jgi:hypothetical protein